MQHILVTGAAGFIGQITARALLSNPSHHVTLIDIHPPLIPSDSLHPSNATTITVDLLSNATHLATLHPWDTVILLHGIMSSGAETNFQAGYAANVDATRNLLFALASARPGVRVLYASSIAVYGSPAPKRGLNEMTPTTPESSYGAQKVIVEGYINDLTRRDLINGFSLRFPGIVVRPGTPTAAASSFMSGIVREPMNGEVCRVPVANKQLRTSVCSPRTLVRNILVAMGWARDVLPRHRRAVLVPGFTVSLQEMEDAVVKVGGEEKRGLIVWKNDERLRPIIESWPEEFDNRLGIGLGMEQDKDFVKIVREYCEDAGLDIR